MKIIFQSLKLAHWYVCCFLFILGQLGRRSLTLNRFLLPAFACISYISLMSVFGCDSLIYCSNFRLEQESGFFFNMKHFEDQVLAGEWDEVERYLCGFTKVEDNRYSMKIFFEIRKQKYLEALDR